MADLASLAAFRTAGNLESATVFGDGAAFQLVAHRLELLAQSIIAQRVRFVLGVNQLADVINHLMAGATVDVLAEE